MTNPDIAAVAAGLTALQRAAITSQAIKDGNQMWVGGSNATLTHLRKKDLAYGMGRFTKLGLAVRAFLTTDEQAMKDRP